MNSKTFLLTSALIGVFCGLISTYPIELSSLPSFVLWAIAGIAIGLFAKGKKAVIWSGILYGIFLSVTFLYSRFGGAQDKLAAYSLFVGAMSIVGAAAGVITVYIGSRLREFKKR